MTYILIGLVLFAALFFIAAARQPDEFRVVRSAVFHAPQAAVFGHVNDMQKWQAWSPWARMEPDAKIVFEGPVAGEGAKIHWEGKKTGKGVMTLIESRPYQRIRFRLEFFKPFKATNEAEFIFLSEKADETRVTWSMSGPNKFIGKVMSLVINCEKMAGSQFEQGFANLREIVEIKI